MKLQLTGLFTSKAKQLFESKQTNLSSSQMSFSIPTPSTRRGKFSTCANPSLPYAIFLALSVNIYSLLTVSLTVNFPA